MRALRNPKSARLISIRPLVRADLALLQQKSHRPRLQRLRDSHHILARLMASGLSNYEVAARGGYSLQSVVSFRSDPSMVELVALYREKDTEAWRESRDEFYGLIHLNGIKAQRMISDQLDDADEANEPIPLNRLLAVAADSADRVGYTKKTTNFNVNVDFAAKLEAARSRMKTINGTSSDAVNLPEDSPRRAS